jgi:hypothetical protein
MLEDGDDFSIFEDSLERFLHAGGRLQMQLALRSAAEVYHARLYSLGPEAVAPHCSMVLDLHSKLVNCEQARVWESLRNEMIIDRASWHNNHGEWTEALELIRDLDAVLLETDERNSALGIATPPRTDLRARRLGILADICALGGSALTDEFGSPRQFIRGYYKLLSQLESNYAQRCALADKAEMAALDQSRSTALQVLTWTGVACACIAWRYLTDELLNLLDMINRTHGTKLNARLEDPGAQPGSVYACWFDAYKAYISLDGAPEKLQVYCHVLSNAFISNTQSAGSEVLMQQGVRVLEALIYSRSRRNRASSLGLEVAVS